MNPLSDAQQVHTTEASLGEYRITVATSAGPRIVGFRRAVGPDPFAKLANESIDHPGLPTYRFIGGHRLWRAPEEPAITYQPDGEPVIVEIDDDVIRITGNEDQQGIVKQITMSLDGPFVVVDHLLENRSGSTQMTAPWAITQMVPGGMAHLPMSRHADGANGVLPDRSLIIWPYTDLSAPEYTFLPGEVVVEASTRRAKMKVGTQNQRGWLAYEFGGDLFVKWSAVHSDSGFYIDMGASAQCYRDERFLELETVGELVGIALGEGVVHREIWQMIEIGDTPVHELLAALPVSPAIGFA